MPHCHDEICNVDHPCTNTIHAEMNAIAFALGVELDSKYGIVNNTTALKFLLQVSGGRIPLLGQTLYCTHAPCVECATIIAVVGISRVLYSIPYRRLEGLKLLQLSEVVVEHLDETTHA